MSGILATKFILLSEKGISEDNSTTLCMNREMYLRMLLTLTVE